MRPVHDILRVRRPGDLKQVLLAFVQWGNSEEGYEYENICPLCAQTVGFVQPEGSPEDLFTYEELVTELRAGMRDHRMSGKCTGSGFHVQVYVTKVPLGTEKKRRVL